jgi:uncharacterized membrane protein
MNNKFFSKIIETVWIIVGLLAAWASINSFLRHDTKNGYLMLLFAVVGFAMFLARRRLRMNRNND